MSKNTNTLVMLTGMTYTISRLNITFFRKLKPPIPSYKGRALQHFSKPRVFEDGGCSLFLNETESHFERWTFINNIDEQTSSNIK